MSLKLNFQRKKLNDSHPHLGTNGVFLMFLHPFFLCCNHNVLIFSLEIWALLAMWLNGLFNASLCPLLQCTWAVLHRWTRWPLASAPLSQIMPQWASSCILFFPFSYFLGITSQAPHYWIQNCEWFPWLWITGFQNALPSVRIWNGRRVKCPQGWSSQTKSDRATPRAPRNY